MQIILWQVYNNFNPDNKHRNFRIHSCFSFLVIEPQSVVYKQKTVETVKSKTTF